MSNGAKIWLIVAASLVLLGSIVFAVGIAMMNFNFTEISTKKYETNNHEITDDFSSISVISKTSNIVFLSTDENKCSVNCYEQKNMKHSVSVKDSVLTIEIDDTRKWYEYISLFDFNTPQITVTIPQGEYNALYVKSDTGNINIPKELNLRSIDITQSTGNVTSYALVSEVIKINTTTGIAHVENASVLDSIKIKTTTGNIRIGKVSAHSIDLSVSTGKITAFDINCEGDVSTKVSTGNAELSDVRCTNITSTGSTGKISLKNVIATEKISIERSTGDVRFERSDAPQIVVVTDTGNVKGSLLTEKVFITETDTGKIRVPNSIEGGRCEITTDTGDIEISIG